MLQHLQEFKKIKISLLNQNLKENKKNYDERLIKSLHLWAASDVSFGRGKKARKRLVIRCNRENIETRDEDYVTLYSWAYVGEGEYEKLSIGVLSKRGYHRQHSLQSYIKIRVAK